MSTGIAPAAMTVRDVVRIEAELDPVLDLGDPAIRRSRGVDGLVIVQDGPVVLEYCRSIADLARSDGFVAIRSPSAAVPGTFNLNIYIDGRADAVVLRATDDRSPLPL